MANTDTYLPSAAEKYGYGTLATVLVCLLALVGIALLPFFKKSIYKYILEALNGLAVSTLFCDALLHMIPKILGLHKHAESAEEHEEHENHNIKVADYVIKMCVAIICLYVFWLLEVLAKRVLGMKLNSIGVEGHSHMVDLDLETPQKEEDTFKSILLCSYLKKVNALGWIIMISDGIHNLADGLAIGASFSKSNTLGVSTTIAVICHEIPHELGNYAVLLKCGLSRVQALLFNLMSASTCLIGFYIGVSVSSNTSASEWILTITLGMFLYIALVELMPSLVRDDNWSWKMFLIINVSLVSGFIIMFLLVVFEEHIKF